MESAIWDENTIPAVLDAMITVSKIMDIIGQQYFQKHPSSLGILQQKGHLSSQQQKHITKGITKKNSTIGMKM